MMRNDLKTYTELIQFPTFEERYKYLRLRGSVGVDTFGFDRIFNQRFYKSREWLKVRDAVFMRDNGCDLGIKGREVYGRFIIHHMNPISLQDLEEHSDLLFNPEYLITTIHSTHNAIHYGDDSLLNELSVERAPFDTCPWRK